MSNKDKALEDGMRRRRPANSIESDVSSTIFGDMAYGSASGQTVPVAEIIDSIFQSRVKLDLDHVEALMAQIQSGGLLSPILIRPIDNPTEPGKKFEVVAGHHRLEAFRRLKIEMIPAVIRRLSNAEAARALTSDNTVRKNYSDWELYKSILMLREYEAATNVTELAAVLHVSRAQVYNLEAFSALPQDVHAMLDANPLLAGASLVYTLKALMTDPQNGDAVKKLVSEAFQLLQEEKLKQAGVLGWIKRKLHSDASRSEVREFSFKEHGSSIKLVLGEKGAKLTGEFDPDALKQLIAANLETIRRK